MAIYRKHFIPLESDPDVFNELINLLGVSPSLRFEDVLSLDGPHLLPGPLEYYMWDHGQRIGPIHPCLVISPEPLIGRRG